MKSMELLSKMSLKNGVERVLHVPGNYTGGILEMTLVVDCALPEGYARETAADVAGILRSHSEVFRNVRSNLLFWKSDVRMDNQVTPLSFIQTGRCFEGYAESREVKALEALLNKLKVFHARSKLILVLGQERLLIRDGEAARRGLQPFLGKKSLFFLQNDPEKKWVRGDMLLSREGRL